MAAAGSVEGTMFAAFFRELSRLPAEEVCLGRIHEKKKPKKARVREQTVRSPH